MKKKSNHRQNAKVISLEPNLRFLAPTVHARCRKAFTKLLETLYENGATAESVPEIQWQVNADSGVVHLTPFSNCEDRTPVPWKVEPLITFQVDDFLPELKTTKSAKNVAACRKLRRQLHDWIMDAIVDAPLQWSRPYSDRKTQRQPE